jgi:O-antigen/teichoic acid export membrane protein
LRIQGIAVVVVAIHLVAVATLWFLGLLGLVAIFSAIAIEYCAAAFVARRLLTHDDSDAAGEPRWSEYVRYCLPLVPYAGVAFAYEFADRWLLQGYGGEVQQAYYAVSAQFAAVALIATTSILSIFWKEVAEAHHRGDHARTGLLYRRVSRLLFLVGAVIAGFLIPWSEALLRLMLGVSYTGGAWTLAIMFLYPVHQSMGQIGSTMLYATERVSVQVVAGVVFMLLSIVATYFVLAPRAAAVPGLELASMGLALKMVVMQLIQVNVIAFLISRIWGWRFDWVYQPLSLIGCVALGWLAHAAIVGLGAADWPMPLPIALGGLLYLLLVAALLFALPTLTGFARAELEADLRNILRRAFPAQTR